MIAIYVGKPFKFGNLVLQYGMTGSARKSDEPSKTAFTPDCCDGWGFNVPRKDVYIPSTQPTRHCPKPS